MLPLCYIASPISDQDPIVVSERLPRTVTRPSREVLVSGNRIICHPAVYSEIKARFGVSS